MSVSFSRIDNFIEEEIPLNLRVPPFLVATKTGRIIFLNAVTFEEQPGTQTLKVIHSVKDSGFPVLPHTTCVYVYA